MQSTVNQYYGLSAISNSLRHFLTGKSVKLITSLATLILLARLLPTQQYAAFISFHALMAISGTIASVGIQPVLFRYLPELRSAGNNHTMYQLLFIGVVSRALIIFGLVVTILPFLPFVADKFNVTQWLWLLPWFLGVGVIQQTALTLSQSLESLLWQREAQYTLALGGVVRLLGIVCAASVGMLNLTILLLIEAVSEILILTLLVLRGRARWREDESRNQGDSAWWAKNRKRVIKYGAWGLAVNQTGVLYGSAPNRLFAAHFFATAEVAILGLADSVIKLARRFMPTRMLIGLIRPIFMARFTETGNFQQLVRMSNMVYRLNMMILMLPIALLTVSGEPFFDWMTANKYGTAAPLLAGFLVLMIIEGLRSLLELLVQAVEKNHMFLVTNCVQSLSLFLAIPFVSMFGLWSLVFANALGTVLANIIVVGWLRSRGFKFRLDVRLTLLIVVYGGTSIILGVWCREKFNSHVLATAVVVMVYVSLVLVHAPLKKTEQHQLKWLFSKSLGKSDNK